MSKTATEFCSTVADYAEVDNTGWSRAEILFGLKSSIAMAVQRGSAECVLNALNRTVRESVASPSRSSRAMHAPRQAQAIGRRDYAFGRSARAGERSFEG